MFCDRGISLTCFANEVQRGFNCCVCPVLVYEKLLQSSLGFLICFLFQKSKREKYFLTITLHTIIYICFPEPTKHLKLRKSHKMSFSSSPRDAAQF